MLTEEPKGDRTNHASEDARNSLRQFVQSVAHEGGPGSGRGSVAVMVACAVVVLGLVWTFWERPALRIVLSSLTGITLTFKAWGKIVLQDAGGFDWVTALVGTLVLAYAVFHVLAYGWPS